MIEKEDGFLTFSVALDLIKQGCRVTREGWHGENMFIFLIPGSTFRVNRPPLLGIYPEGTEIRYLPHIAVRTPSGCIAEWVASHSDMLAEDWLIMATMDEVGDE